MTAPVTVRVVSAVKGMITGGDAVVEATAHDPTKDLRLVLNGVDVTDCMTTDIAPGVRRGLVTGFVTGENTVEARVDDDRAQTSVRNFPVQGPLFSGPHLNPWRLTTEENSLGPALDQYGNAAPRFEFYYRGSQTNKFQTYDPDAPPPAAEIATTVTDDGKTVPYIVRREIGAAGRGIYEIAVLFDPATPWTALAPQDGWNRKVWLFFYGGWNTFWSQSVFGLGQADFKPGTPKIEVPAFVAELTSILQDMGLRRGHMVARTTPAQSASNCDSVRGAESLVLLKEHIAKRYGDIRWTIASGASGGSIMQQMIANQYPGLLQGIMPLSSLHASWYIPTIVTDCRLLTRYFSDTSPQLWADEGARLAVDGHWAEITRQTFMSAFVEMAGDADPTRGTNLPKADTYHPIDNPGGARATLQDYQVNYLGTRTHECWTDIERGIGRGFANRPAENVGVQYGLAALLDGTITVEQFLDLNAKIGWVDIDGEFIDERVGADPAAVELLHRGGFINDAAHLNEVAILDQRPPEPEDLIKTHTQFHTWVIRQALIDAHGHADNHVAWITPGHMAMTPTEAAFDAMDRWLTSVDNDTTDRSLADKIVTARPADLTDGIWDVDGNQLGNLEEMHRRYPVHGDARSVAACGKLRAFRIAKPQHKPLERADYPGVDFNNDQWAQLHQIFPDGVADWTRPGIGHTPTVAWLDYTKVASETWCKSTGRFAASSSAYGPGFGRQSRPRAAGP
jgi:hypothetical protein